MIRSVFMPVQSESAQICIFPCCGSINCWQQFVAPKSPMSVLRSLVDHLCNITVFITASRRSFNVLFVYQRFYALLDHRYVWRKRVFRLCDNLWMKWIRVKISHLIWLHCNRMETQTSWMRALCLSIFLDFMMRTMAACKYSFRSSSTALIVCSTSCGVSRCSAAEILNFVRLFE